MNPDFSPNSALIRELTRWWEEDLQKNRGARAELRRCASVDEVAMTAVFARLCHSLRGHFEGEHGWQDRLAAIAGLLAHLRSLEPGKTLPERMAERKAGGSPAVSELRFRRLLQRNRSELYPSLVRVLHMLGYSADLSDLAEALYYWGDRIKKKWAYAYFPKVA